MVCSLHSVTTGSRDRANVSLIIIIIINIGRTSVFQFSLFLYDVCGLEKLGILLIKTGWNVFVRFVAENAGRG